MELQKLVPVFAALLLVAMSGCGALSGTGTPQETSTDASTPSGEPVITNDMSAEDIRQLSANATEGYSTYEMNMTMSVEASSGTVEMSTAGVIDTDARKAHMDVAVDAGFRSVDTEVYIDDQTLYAKNQRGGWKSESMTGQSSMNWDQTDQLEQQQELLNKSAVSLSNSTTIDGEPVTVISIDPSDEALQEMMAQQQSTATDVSVSEMSMTMYISNYTTHIRQMDMDADYEANGQSASMDMTVELWNYGIDTDIKIPEAAK